MDFHIFRFDAFLLDPASRELKHHGERVAIPPKSLECLEYLVRNRARAVGRDELISAVWGRADVSDALLAQTLLRARRAVGDTGNEQVTIRTVPRFGYQWVAPVEEVEREADSSRAAAVVESSNPDAAESPRGQSVEVAKPSTRWRSWLTLALLAVATASLATLTWRATRMQSAPEPSGNLYVVAPVLLEDRGTETAWVRLGVMDYVATRLREDGSLSVLPSQRVVALIGTAPTDASETGMELRQVTAASHLVQPSARRIAGGWQVVLDVTGETGPKRFLGEGATPLIAANKASSALLADMGTRVGTEPDGTWDGLQEGLQRIDAAMLEGDLPAARAVLAAISPSLQESPEIRVREGQILFRGGRIDEADGVFSGLQARLGALPVETQAQVLMGLGAVAVRRRDFSAAELRYSEALAVLGEQGSQELLGNGFNGRGVARAAQEQFDLALADFSRARIALGRSGDAPGVASIDTNLGLLEARRGQWTQALQAFDRAIDVFGRYRVDDSLAAAVMGKSRVQLAIIDFSSTLKSSEQASELATGLENPVLASQIALLRADILIRTGFLTAASRILEGLFTADAPMEARALAIELALARGDNATALNQARQLQALSGSGRNIGLLVRAAIANAESAATLDSVFETAWQTDEGMKEDDASDRFSAALSRALWQAYRGDRDESVITFENVLAMKDRSIAPVLRVEAMGQYVEYLVARNQLDRATELSGQLEGYADRDYRTARALGLLYRALGDSTLLESAMNHMRELAGERSMELPAPAQAASEIAENR